MSPPRSIPNYLLYGNLLLSLVHSWTLPQSFSTAIAVICKSNSTYISWQSSLSSGDNSDRACTVQTRSDAEDDCLEYLYSNLMPYDVPIARSLGFIVSEEEDETTQPTTSKDRQLTPLPDGLSHGIVEVSIQMSLDAKIKYPWTNDVPKDIYLEYVLPYGNVDEARTNWRPLLSKVLEPTIKNLLLNPQQTTEDVVHAVNTDLWSALGGINFKAGQTPLVYDPMSTIAFNYASCTGLSILFVNALRSVGVPARLAGTPAWNGEVENGNHSWVEVYCSSSKRWTFLESTPAAGGVPALHPDPCKNWFCDKKRFDGKTKVFAARLDKNAAGGTFFPMTWNIGSEGVPAEDRTEWITELCSKC